MKPHDLNTILQTIILSEVMLMQLEDVEGAYIYKQETKVKVKSLKAHLEKVSKQFTANTNGQESDNYSLVTGEIYRKVKEIQANIQE